MYRDDPIWRELQACLSELDRYKSKSDLDDRRIERLQQKSDLDDRRIERLQQKIDDMPRQNGSKLVSVAWFFAYIVSAYASFMVMLSPSNRSVLFVIITLTSFCAMVLKGLMHWNRVIE